MACVIPKLMGIGHNKSEKEFKLVKAVQRH